MQLDKKRGVVDAIMEFEAWLSGDTIAEPCHPDSEIGVSLVKQRLSRSGMVWTTEGVNKVLAIRQLVLSEDRWTQFWQKIERYGF